MKTKIAYLAGMLLTSAAATGAQAGVYGWVITGPNSNFSGSGQLTTEDTPTATPEDVAGTNSGLGYLLTSFTGTFAGKTVRLKDWDPDDGPYYADNLFYPTGHNPYADLDGWLFETLKANGSVQQVYNLFDSHTCGGDTGGCWEQALIGYPHISGGSRSVTLTLTVITAIPPPPAVPEPATWAMMIGGFGMVGGAMRRKQAVVRFA